MIEITEIGIDKILKKLEHYEERKGKALDTIKDITAVSIAKNYQAEGRSPHWIARMHSYPWPILWKTGKKRQTEIDSAMAGFRNQGKEHVLNVRSTDYGVYHQEGRGQEIRKSAKLVKSETERCLNAIRRILKAKG